MTFMKALPAVAVTLAVSVTFAAAQTVVKAPKNRYTPQQDVELGREAAAEVRKQYPIISDERITSYLAETGRSAGRRRAGRSSSSRSTSTRSRR